MSIIIKPNQIQWTRIQDPKQVPVVERLSRILNILGKISIIMNEVNEQTMYEIIRLSKMKNGELEQYIHVIKERNKREDK